MFRVGCRLVDSSAYSNRAKRRTRTITPHITASACSITAPYKRSLVSPTEDERILSTRAITKKECVVYDTAVAPLPASLSCIPRPKLLK